MGSGSVPPLAGIGFRTVTPGMTEAGAGQHVPASVSRGAAADPVRRGELLAGHGAAPGNVVAEPKVHRSVVVGLRERPVRREPVAGQQVPLQDPVVPAVGELGHVGEGVARVDGRHLAGGQRPGRSIDVGHRPGQAATSKRRGVPALDRNLEGHHGLFSTSAPWQASTTLPRATAAPVSPWHRPSGNLHAHSGKGSRSSSYQVTSTTWRPVTGS